MGRIVTSFPSQSAPSGVLDNQSLDVSAADYTTTSEDAGKTYDISSSVDRTINIEGLSAGMWVSFVNQSSYTFTFASTLGITSDGCSALGASDGKLKLIGYAKTVTAYADSEGYITLVGNPSA